VRLLPGRHIGYRLTTNGRVLRRRVLDLATTAETRSAKLMQLPGRGGWWLYIVEGKLSGFWVRATEQRHLRP
jgi:hypothetical protein